MEKQQELEAYLATKGVKVVFKNLLKVNFHIDARVSRVIVVLLCCFADNMYS